MQENLMMYEKYKKTSVETSSPGKLLLMLYDGAINRVEAAMADIGEQRIAEAHGHIVKAQDIVLELRNTLNMEYSIAESLWQLYDFLYTQLVEANIHKDRQQLEQVLSFLTELRETWQEALRQAGPTSAMREQMRFVNITG
jgi:flagellar protein FliS